MAKKWRDQKKPKKKDEILYHKIVGPIKNYFQNGIAYKRLKLSHVFLYIVEQK